MLSGTNHFPVCPGQNGPLTQKFLSKVDAHDGDLSKCWEWQGHRAKKGYGVLSISKREQCRAHRYAYKIFHGREPREQVLHLCDNPSCVNPTHLMDGSHGENMRQMAARKRAAREERHHNAKLLFNEVLAILVLHKGGSYSTRDLAKLFTISQPTIGQIIQGKLWPDAHALADAMLAERDRAREESE